MFAMSYLLFDLVNILGILIWSLGHNVWNFYLHFRTFKLGLCYCYVPCLWHTLSCVRLSYLLKRGFWHEKYQLRKFFLMCFVFHSSPSVNIGYFYETLVIFVLAVEVGFVSWFSVEAGEVRVHLFCWGTITLSYVL